MKSASEIRNYQDTDQEALVKLLRLNTPKYFDPSEEENFVRFLEKGKEDYFVLEKKGQVVGCGGINYFPDRKLSTNP